MQQIRCNSFFDDKLFVLTIRISTHVCLRLSGADLRLRDDDEDLGYVAIGFEGPTFSRDQCKDRYAFEVAKEIVGSWDMTYGN